jgi:hypothetical protein
MSHTAPVAYEFYNPETGHAIVDYSEHTHAGHLTAEKGYVKKPLSYSCVGCLPALNPPPEEGKPCIVCGAAI